MIFHINDQNNSHNSIPEKKNRRLEITRGCSVDNLHTLSLYLTHFILLHAKNGNDLQFKIQSLGCFGFGSCGNWPDLVGPDRTQPKIVR